MRAEFIFEKVNFERGNEYDPLRTLNIGHKKTEKELEAMYKKVLHFNLGVERKSFSNEISAAIPERLLASCGWGNAFKCFEEMWPEEIDKFDRILTKYYNKFKE
jgi:hypothetical protein